MKAIVVNFEGKRSSALHQFEKSPMLSDESGISPTLSEEFVSPADKLISQFLLREVGLA